MTKKGDYVRVITDHYGKKNYNKVFRVEHVAHNESEHPGYDNGVGGELIDLYGLDSSLYEFEFEPSDYKEYLAQEKKNRKKTRVYA